MGPLLQFVAVILAAWIALPRLLRMTGRGPTVVRATRLVTFGAALWTAIGTALAAVASVELATIVGVAAASGLVIRLIRVGHTPSIQSGARLFDLFDPGGPHSLARQLARARHALGRWIRRSAMLLVSGSTLPAAVVFTLAVAGELAYPLWHASPTEHRGYAYLLATKQVALNHGLFQGGLYPEGWFSLMAALATAFFQDPLNLLRFWPALTTGVALLSTAALARELTRSRIAPALAMAIAAFTSLPAWGWPLWSLTVPLELRWASLFVPAGILGLLRYARTGRSVDRWMAGAATLTATLTEPWVGASLLAAALVHLIVQRERFDRAGRSAVTVAAATAAGILPLAGGWLAHLPVNLLLWGNPLIASVHMAWGWWVAGVLTTAGVTTIGVRGPRPHAVAVIGVWVVAGLLAALFSGARPVLLGGGVLGLPSVAVLAAVTNGGPFRWPAYRTATWLAAAILFGTAAWLAPAQPSAPLVAEPPGTGLEYLRIAGQFPAYQWTIVSPDLQYSEVLGRGWHVELWDFARDESLGDARNPRFRPADNPRLPITTPNVFLFLEPWPFGLGRPVTAGDLRQPLPAAPIYRGRSLAVIEAHVLAWARIYLHTHPKTAHIYFRSPGLVVIWITQPGP
jgi:hypothetical protein